MRRYGLVAVLPLIPTVYGTGEQSLVTATVHEVACSRTGFDGGKHVTDNTEDYLDAGWDLDQTDPWPLVYEVIDKITDAQDDAKEAVAGDQAQKEIFYEFVGDLRTAIPDEVTKFAGWEAAVNKENGVQGVLEEIIFDIAEEWTAGSKFADLSTGQRALAVRRFIDAITDSIETQVDNGGDGVDVSDGLDATDMDPEFKATFSAIVANGKSIQLDADGQQVFTTWVRLINSENGLQKDVEALINDCPNTVAAASVYDSYLKSTYSKFMALAR